MILTNRDPKSKASKILSGLLSIPIFQKKKNFVLQDLRNVLQLVCARKLLQSIAYTDDYYKMMQPFLQNG